MSPSLRFRHLASGLLVAVGCFTIVLSLVTAAADGLHGFADVFEFLGTLGFSAFAASVGWEWSE